MEVVRKRIPAPLYRKIQGNVPIFCVDLVISNGKEFLLLKRKNRPDAGQWFFPGGRVLKNELAKDAAIRKLKEEAGLFSKNLKMLGFYEYLSKEGIFKGVSTHTPCVAFLAKVSEKDKNKVILSPQNEDFRWFSKIEKNFHPYLKKFLKIAGFN